MSAVSIFNRTGRLCDVIFIKTYDWSWRHTHAHSTSVTVEMSNTRICSQQIYSSPFRSSVFCSGTSRISVQCCIASRSISVSYQSSDEIRVSSKQPKADRVTGTSGFTHRTDT